MSCFRVQKYIKTAFRPTLFDERGLRIDENGIGVDVGWCGELYFIVPLWV